MQTELDKERKQSHRTVAEDDRVPGSLDHGCPHRSSRVMDRREPRIGDRIEFEKQALRGDSIESTLDATLTEHCVAGRINRAGAARDPRLVAFVKRCQDPNKTLLQYLVFGIIFRRSGGATFDKISRRCVAAQPFLHEYEGLEMVAALGHQSAHRPDLLLAPRPLHKRLEDPTIKPVDRLGWCLDCNEIGDRRRLGSAEHQRLELTARPSGISAATASAGSKVPAGDSPASKSLTVRT